MKVACTAIPDVKLIEPHVFGDGRGFLFESWNLQTYRDAGLELSFVQDNHTGSSEGTLRGLHYQVGKAQGKLVRVVVGEVVDVAVDLRRTSETFGRVVVERLSAANRRQLWVPPGFAHGFYVVSGWAEVLYKCTDFYAPDLERTLRWDDPALGIEWPLVGGRPPILSEKDTSGLSFAEAPTYP